MKNEQYEKILRQLSRDFDRCLLDEIEKFNQWVWKVCKPQIERGQTVVVATLRLLRAEVAPLKTKPRRMLTHKLLEQLPREFQPNSA